VNAPSNWVKYAEDTASLHTVLATHSRVMIDHSTSSAPTLTMITLAWVESRNMTLWGRYRLALSRYPLGADSNPGRVRNPPALSDIGAARLFAALMSWAGIGPGGLACWPRSGD
jgi:hypothetical protein